MVSTQRTLQFTAAEEQQRIRLNRMKAAATGLLFVVSVLFVLSSIYAAHAPVLLWVRAFAEAAMVGALADWFAVTALFRHPLGIPIPHTAIVPSKKERIGEDLGNFIQSNFLSVTVLKAKIEQFNPAVRFADWLISPGIAEAIADRLTSGFGRVIGAMDDADVRRLVEHNVEVVLRDMRAAPLLGNLLGILWESDEEQRLPELGLQLIERLLEENQAHLSDAMWHELPWYIPQFLRKKIFARILLRFKSSLHEINSDPYHPVRGKMGVEISSFIDRLKHSPQYHHRAEELKAQLLESPALREYFQQLSGSIKERLRRAVVADRCAVCDAIAHAITSFGRQLKDDEKLQRKLNVWLKAAGRDFVRTHRRSIVAYIADTTGMWDTKTVVNKIELQVGRDLQYIRLNGTIVGGLVGLLLELLSRGLLQ